MLYAAHLSDHMTVPGRVWACIIGIRVAASLFVTISIYPIAGICVVSTIPNAHTGGSACPLPPCRHIQIYACTHKYV